MRPRISIVLTGSSVLAFASVAGAQTVPSDTGVTGKSDVSLEEIVVTARRRAEVIEDVPQVVDAVTPETLAKYNIQQFQDVAALVPGLTLTNDGSGLAATAALRGADFQINSATSPTVQFYLNEAVIDANFLLQSMFDVGQIEVLRGPQGTLRGRSAPSGAITVSTHQADLSGFGAYAAVTGTDRDQIKGEGALNVPIITDKLAIRFAGLIDDNQFDHVKSINDPQAPHQHTTAERVSVSFEPSDSFTFTGMYQHLERNVRSYVQVAGSGAPGAPFGTCNITGATGLISIPCPAAGYNGPVISPEDRVGVSNQAVPVSAKYDVVTAQAEYRFGGQKLVYVGGYSKQNVLSNEIIPDSANMVPGGVVPLEAVFTHQSQVSQELRLASEERIAGLFDYTAGLYYGLEKPVVQLPWPASYLNGAFGTPGQPLGLPSPYELDNRYLIHSYTDTNGRREERSIFGSITWHIDDKTELTGGGRYIVAKDDESTNAFLRSDGIIALPLSALGAPAGTPCSFIPGAVGSTYPGSCDFPSTLVVQSGQVLATASKNRWTPKVYNASLSHHFTDNLLAYVDYGTAWRRGPTSVGIQNADNDPELNSLTYIKPENSKAWEIGLKSTWLDHRARVNLALYRQTYDGFIYLTPFTPYLANNGTGNSLQIFQFTTNVPAVVTGVDLDTLFQVTRRWSMGLALSYADGHMRDASIPCNDSNGDGIPDTGTVTAASFAAGQHINLCKVNNSITSAPTWSAKLQSEYSMPITSAMDGYVRGLLTYYPKNDRASGEGSGFTADQYGILNLYMGVRSDSGAWDVQLFARNVTNTQRTLTYAQSMEVSSVNPISEQFGPSGYYKTSVTPLREFGITARYAFGPH